MNILSEIVEKSDDIIALLESNRFFDKNIFCPRHRLHFELQVRMQRKWEQEQDIHLTTEEFETVIQGICQEEVSETIYSLVDKGVLAMGVNPDGHITYSLSDTGTSIVNCGEFVKILRKGSNK